LIVRQSVFSDEADLVRMGEAFFNELAVSALIKFSPESLVEFVRAASMNENSRVWVAEEEGKIVGAAAGICYPFYFTGELTTQELFWWVDPEARKLNVGKSLYQTLEDWAVENGSTTIQMVAIENGSAESVGKIYKRMGFMPNEHTYIRGLK